MRGRRFGAVGWASLMLCLGGAAASLFHAAAICRRRGNPPGDPATRRQGRGGPAEGRRRLACKRRDGRLSGLLNSYLEGNLYLWDGQPVIGEQAASDANGKRASLLDPLTLQPLLEEGKPVVVPLGEIKEVDLAAQRTEIGQRRHASRSPCGRTTSKNGSPRFSAPASQKSWEHCRHWRKSSRPIPRKRSGTRPARASI